MSSKCKAKKTTISAHAIGFKEDGKYFLLEMVIFPQGISKLANFPLRIGKLPPKCLSRIQTSVITAVNTFQETRLKILFCL